jgi:hypothetical protein
MEVSGQLQPQEKSSWYPLDRGLSGPQSRSERGGEEKNSQPPPGNELPIIQPVAQRYPGSLLLDMITLIISRVCVCVLPIIKPPVM